MSVSTIQKMTGSLIAAARGIQQVAAQSAPGKSFAETVASLGNGTPYSDEEVKSFFAAKPSAQQIAGQGVRLGLNEDQIARAMTVGGYGGGDPSALKTEIESFVAKGANGYAWNGGGALTFAKVDGESTTALREKAMPSAHDIKAFYATCPTDSLVTEKAKALGLSAAQMVQFQVTGIGMDVKQVSANVLECMYVDAAGRLGADIGGGANGGWTSYFSPTLGRAVTQSELRSFFGQKPSQSQIFQKAADLGLGIGAVNNMMNSLGIPDVKETYGSRYNMMDTSLYQGRDGFSLDGYGRIVAGGGHQLNASADGTSGSWVQSRQPVRDM